MPHVNGITEKSTKSGRERPGRPGGNTADLVKRRYSTRFVQPSDFINADAPPFPKVHPPDTESIQNISVDVAALKDPGLDPEKYTATVLSDASDQQLRDFQTSLRKLKNRASTDLQQNVYQNRTQFIKISKDAEKLNEDMRALRSHMSELSASVSNLSANTVVPEARSSFENAAARTRKQANRSSVANLEQIYNNQLQTLWKEVEGSQKFLPAIPGRHVEIEQRRWAELDAATWKPKQKVRLILLNDHLMVAREKSRNRVNPNATGKAEAEQKVSTRLVAEKCWPLQDIDMLDLAPMGNARDKHEMANAISIRCGHKSYTYQSERSSSTEKDQMLRKFRQTAEELRRLLRTDTQAHTKSTKAMEFYSTRDPTVAKKTDLLRSLSNSNDRSEILIDVDGKQKNLRWVEGQMDEVDIEVALQHFEEAVSLIEELRTVAQGLKGNSMVQDLINTKIDGRASTLADLVVERLISTHSFSNATQTNIKWLVRLGFDDRARDSFLVARSETITKRARQCIFEGDLRDYIFQVSFVYFILMRNTVSIFQQCFPPLMMSACVRWAKEHLDGFNVILSRQLSSVQRGSPTWNECMDQAKEHAMMVNDVGLDFKELVKVKEDGE
ncbi:MAG: hypothetical protein LQ339_004119 [Xanthoria mediterranea]|nr:MAG: hypothetical protein LQ339_004119 [Xanthoria mediterranea]